MQNPLDMQGRLVIVTGGATLETAIQAVNTPGL